MKRRIIILTLILSLLLLLTSCSMEATMGSVRGVVFFSEHEQVVPNAWVAIYEEATPDIIHILVQADAEGRYAMVVPEGNYIALGATFQDGPFTGIDTVFSVLPETTSVKTIVIDTIFWPPD